MTLGWLPNAITFARMALAVPLAWLILEERFGAALVVAAVAGASDGIDGWLAKRYGWRSWLGGVIDPVADKLMLLAAYATLTVEGHIALWLFALVVARDVVIVAGATLYHNLVGRLDAKPTTVSKLTTLVQILYVLALLVHLTPVLELSADTRFAFALAVALVTLASGLDYVVRWSLKAIAIARHRREAAGR